MIDPDSWSGTMASLGLTNLSGPARLGVTAALPGAPISGGAALTAASPLYATGANVSGGGFSIYGTGAGSNSSSSLVPSAMGASQVGTTDQSSADQLVGGIGQSDMDQAFSGIDSQVSASQSPSGSLYTPSSSGSNFNALGAGASALGLGGSIYGGSSIGAIGSAAGLASNLGVPSSVTNPVSIGASLAGTGLDLATGNYLGAAMGALGLGGAAAGIPSSVMQPLGLFGSILSGNPIGMAVNGAKVGMGLYNMTQGLNYNGSWTPSATQQSQIADSMNQATTGLSTDVDSTIAANQSQIDGSMQAATDSVDGFFGQGPWDLQSGGEGLWY